MSLKLVVDEAGCMGQVTVMPDMGLRELLVALAKRADVRDVLVEAGSGLSSAFIAEELVDNLVVYQAPVLLGASAKPCFDREIQQLRDGVSLKLEQVEQVGADLKLNFSLVCANFD